MISFIKGKVEDRYENAVIIENHGIGYEIFVSTPTLRWLNEGEEAALYTYLSVKEDGIALFGFSSKEERDVFLSLLTISGVGPKLAISVLSGIALEELVHAIATANVKALSSIKGIGKKTAERIVLELKDKLKPMHWEEAEQSESISQDMKDEAVIALSALGFTKNEAVRAISRLQKTYTDVNDLISDALRSM